EGPALGALPELHQPHPALLDQPAGDGGHATGGKPRVRRAGRGVAGGGQLLGGGEDRHPVVRAGRGGRGEERGLREVRPRREALHLLGAQPDPVDDDGERVALVGPHPEDVDLAEAPLHAGHLNGRARHRLEGWRSWSRRATTAPSSRSSTTTALPVRPPYRPPAWPAGSATWRPRTSRPGCGPTPPRPTPGCCAPACGWHGAMTCGC